MASSHRLPTLSASQALSASQSTSSHISTGSDELNKALGGAGLPRGKITELSGPPGSGKTAVGAVWIDTSHPLPISRLVSVLSAASEKDPESLLDSLEIVRAPSLAHLLALILHPLPSFPREDTSLVVIDNISTIFTAAYPPGMEDVDRRSAKEGKPPGAGTKRGKEGPGARRFAIIGDITTGLAKLAAAKDLAILVLNQMTTRVIPGVGATLTPAVSSPAWITSLTSRLVIHFNNIPVESIQDPSSVQTSQVRFVTVLKSPGGASRDREFAAAPVVLVKIQESGVGDVGLVSSLPIPAPVKPYSPVKRKRKRGIETGVIPGSDEDEDDEEEGVEEVESGPEDDGMGAAIQSPTRKEEGQAGFTRVAAVAEGGESLL